MAGSSGRCLAHGVGCACILVSIIFLLVYTFTLGDEPSSIYAGMLRLLQHSDDSDRPPFFPNQNYTNETKVIMFWTTWYQNKIWFNLHKSALGTSMFHHRLCTRHTNCILTNDHSQLRYADLLLFYYADAVNWPHVRYAHQYYAHFIHEAPGARNTFLDKYEGKINITINFRHDADLYMPYTIMWPRQNKSKYIPRIPLSKKHKMALWPVSHCRTSSHREDYVKELSKYITVDIYGGCGKHKCPRSRTLGCLKEWESSYKFYLSFENNMCEDYITEKMFQPLRYELIPVVLGAGNYSRDAPPHSVINSRDFSSPKALADFLISVADDEEKYYSYFAWKPYYDFVRAQDWMMCK